MCCLSCHARGSDYDKEFIIVHICMYGRSLDLCYTQMERQGVLARLWI